MRRTITVHCSSKLQVAIYQRIVARSVTWERPQQTGRRGAGGADVQIHDVRTHEFRRGNARGMRAVELTDLVGWEACEARG
jgi:hypothetical protein